MANPAIIPQGRFPASVAPVGVVRPVASQAPQGAHPIFQMKPASVAPVVAGPPSPSHSLVRPGLLPVAPLRPLPMPPPAAPPAPAPASQPLPQLPTPPVAPPRPRPTPDMDYSTSSEVAMPADQLTPGMGRDSLIDSSSPAFDDVVFFAEDEAGSAVVDTLLSSLSDGSRVGADEFAGVLVDEVPTFSGVDCVYVSPQSVSVPGTLSGTSYMVRFTPSEALPHTLRHLSPQFFSVPVATIKKIEKVRVTV